MAYKDYYKILGVEKSASEKEIKKAYRKLATEFHPDKTKGDKAKEDRFKEISEANQVLGNPEKRKQYDALGADWEHFQQSGSSFEEFMAMKNRYGKQQQRQYHRQKQPSGFDEGTDYSDFFESFFGGRQAGYGRRQTAYPGADLTGEVVISLQEAYSGTERILQAEGNRIKLKIKPGAYTGLQLRARGKGQKGDLGKAGDLYVKVAVEPHPVFERRGDDLYMTAPLSLFDALLGGPKEVVTLSGKVTITLKEGTQNGKTVRLKGKGMPVYGKPGQFGDLFVKLQVELPVKLTPAQRDLVKNLKKSIETKG